MTLELGEMRHAAAFGEILPQEAVGVLIGPALPGVVGRGEVDARGGGTLEVAVLVEFGAVDRR
jgi:hypothetical protein